MLIPIYVTHFGPNVGRRRYLEQQFARTGLGAHWIIEFDAGEFDPGSHYQFAPSLFRRMIEPIKEIMVGYSVGTEQWPGVPWRECVERIRRKNLSLEQWEETLPWLRPVSLNAASVSISLKHHLAWDRIAAGEDEWAVVAEDDIVFRQSSRLYLEEVVRRLPAGTDCVDIAGGCGLLPRVANRVENEFLFEADPPRDRTCCAVLMRRSFARRLVALRAPICLPADWTLTWAFNELHARVFWVDPGVFGHGSEMNVYRSGTR